MNEDRYSWRYVFNDGTELKTPNRLLIPEFNALTGWHGEVKVFRCTEEEMLDEDWLEEFLGGKENE